MSAELAITLGVIGLFGLLLILEVPIAWCLAISGALGIILLRSFDIGSGLLGSIPYQAASSYTFVVVPLYIFLGALVNKAHIAERVYAVASRVFRRLPGGLGIATIAACAGFAAVSGSSVATAATIGKMSVGEMRRHGYKDTFATGIVGIAATLGILIPPSLVLIMYGIISGESIAKLFAAGIIPGILSAVVYSIFISIMARKRVQAPVRVAAGGGSGALGPADIERVQRTRITKAQALRSVGYIVVIFTTIMVGIFTGVMTTTESAAVSSVLALLFFLYENRKKKRRDQWTELKDALQETSGITSMAFAILIGAAIFTFFLVSARVPYHAAEFLSTLDVPPLVVVFLILAATIPLGMFLDSLAILVIVVPLVYPTLTGMGFSGIWFGILMVKMIEVSLITPPVGLNAFVIASSSGVKLEKVFRGLVPFIFVELIIVTILVFFPEITLFLPDLVSD